MLRRRSHRRQRREQKNEVGRAPCDYWRYSLCPLVTFLVLWATAALQQFVVRIISGTIQVLPQHTVRRLPSLHPGQESTQKRHTMAAASSFVAPQNSRGSTADDDCRRATPESCEARTGDMQKVEIEPSRGSGSGSGSGGEVESFRTMDDFGNKDGRGNSYICDGHAGIRRAPPSRNRVPFFWNGDPQALRGVAGHLERRVESYREDLVKVVQGLDLIINRLQEAAATAGTGDRDLPGEGVRRLAAKLKRKMQKTPPRWQTNTDMLAWLLRPVPFVAGLPAPANGPAPPVSSEASSVPPATMVPDEEEGPPLSDPTFDPAVALNDSGARGRRLEDAGGCRDGSSLGTASTCGGQDKQASDDQFAGDSCVGVDQQVLASQCESMALEDEPVGGDAVGVFTGGGSGLPVEERRPAPFVQGPAARLADALEELSRKDGGETHDDDGKQQKKTNRMGFYAYDETHQVFTHMLRDWTAEGRSVRAAVYDPLLQALDLYLGARGCDASPDPAAGAADCEGTLGRSDESRRGDENCHSSPGDRPQPANVLVPGAGLGRLAAEIAARGYASVHANELSPTMLSSSYWLMDALRDTDQSGGQGSRPPSMTAFAGDGDDFPCPPPPTEDGTVDCEDDFSPSADGEYCLSYRNQGGVCDRESRENNSGEASGSTDDKRKQGIQSERERGRGFSFEFYPFLNDATHNEMDGEARFRPVVFPDVDARGVLASASGRLSFQAGEFCNTYGAAGGPFEAAFDAVVTSFFVDTAPNVVEYVAAIRRTLKFGGVWINCGPLHWHNNSALALSLDELLALVSGSGFRVDTVERLPACAYRVDDGARSLRLDEFRPVFWIAVLEGGHKRGP